jgi:3-deoxy-D-manno-octulosonic acid kinase
MAARCERINALVYRGDLISEKIPASQTLAEIASIKALSHKTWSKVGYVIAQFHDNNVYHADLNAHNILLVPDGSVYLIDFDKSGINPRFRFNWARSNLNRLKRSLHKLRKNLPVFHFSDQNWRAVNEGYIKYFSTLGSKAAVLVQSSEEALPVLTRLI